MGRDGVPHGHPAGGEMLSMVMGPSLSSGGRTVGNVLEVGTAQVPFPSDCTSRALRPPHYLNAQYGHSPMTYAALTAKQWDTNYPILP